MVLLAGQLHMARSLQFARAIPLNAERESEFPRAYALRHALGLKLTTLVRCIPALPCAARCVTTPWRFRSER